jgi:AmmeMemoRadiSam system protein A
MKRIALVWAIFSFMYILYCGCAFSQDTYSAQEKEYMLNLARETLVWYLGFGQVPRPNPQELTDNLKENRPCFVTLMNAKQLRGCIGMFEFNRPLYGNIIDKAISAATGDWRFSPVTSEELKYITIEISILTEPKELKFANPEDLLNKLHPFEDGVILYTEYGESTYLPQVWEQLPLKEDFLSNLCQKHGAPTDYWRANYTKLKVEIYKAIHFQEESAGIKKIIGPNGAVVGKGRAKVIGIVSLSNEFQGSGGYVLQEGAQLKPGMIVTQDSDISER